MTVHGGALSAAQEELSEGEYLARIDALRAAMGERGFDAVVLASPENLYYLAGLNHYGYFAPTLLIVRREGPLEIIATPSRTPTCRSADHDRTS